MKQMLFSISLVTALSMSAIAASGPVIGIATSDGSLSVNNSQVNGNANLSAGTVVRTDSATGRVQLYGGTKMVLGNHSQVKVFPNKVLLDQGSTQLAGSSSYPLEALGIRVSPSAHAQAMVRVQDSKVLVAALNGPVHVTNTAGVPLASVVSGRSLSFQATEAPSTASSMRGTLTKENGRFVLPDETSGLKVQLTGEGLEREIGRRVSVTGSASPSSDNSTQLIQVARLNRMPEPGPEPSPAPAPQTPTTGVPGAGGPSGMTVGLIIGVATAATFGTIWGIKYANEDPAPISR